MQTLTPEEINRINDLKASGYKPNEILTQIASTRTGTPLASSYTPVSGIGGPTETQQDIAGTFSDIGGSFKKFTSNINRAATKEGLSRSQRFAGGLLTVPTLALDLVGDVITGTAKTAVGQKTEEAVGGAIASGVSAAMGTDFAKGITNWYDNLDPASQYTASQIIAPLAEAVTETGTGGIFGKLLSRGKKAVPDRAAIEKAVTEAATEARTGNIAPATRIVNATVDPIERQKAVDNLTKAYMESMVEDRTAINNRLDDIASQVNRYSDTDVTRETLISNLANEGYIPVPEGRRARFEDSIRDVQSRQSALMSDMEGLLQEVRDTVSTSEFYDAVRASLRNDPRVGTDINSALRRIDELERGAKAQYGNTLRPLDVNKLKVEGNMKRGDVGKNVDPIVTDAWSNVARTANEWMNSKIDNELFKRTNAEWSRLQTLEDTMMALRNQQIDVGVIGRALGSYLTVVTGSSAGLATGGPGGLVVAGILSKMGADALADMLRKKAFSPEATQIIRDVMRNDDMLREELKRTAKTTQAKNELDDFVRALPAPKEGAADASIYVPQPAPQAGVRSAGTPIEKTSQTGKLLNPEEQAVINQQAGRFKTPETFINAVKNNPRWLAKLEAAGVTPEQVAKVVFSGTAAYFLVSYTDENGLLPVGVIALSALPANERATVIKEATKAAKTTGKTLKLSDEVADDVLKSLNMESAVEKITRASDFDADDVARLDALQQTSKKAPLTDEELLEAKAIMEKYGDVFPDGKLPKADVTPQTTALLEEARPYFADPRKIPKTEQEFIKAHTLYHGANTKFADQLEKTKTFKPGAKREAGTGGNFYGLSATTDARMAQDFSTSATGEGRVVELYIDPKAKVLNMRGKALDDLSEAETRKLAKEYDVIRDIDNVGGESEVRILNPDVLRDRSQIESAWVLQDTGITDLYKD